MGSREKTQCRRSRVSCSLSHSTAGRRNRCEEREAELAREKKAREAAEKAERIQAEANRKAKRRIRIGSIVLGVTLLVAGISTVWGSIKLQEARNAIEQKQEAEKALAKTNKALETVRGLSVLAGELRKNGKVEESKEALRKAGLSTLISNEELKQTFLLAATAEAYQSLGEQGREKAQDILKNLKLTSLNINKSQLDPGILNQVKAFAYFQAGKVKGEKYYQDAYDALKASKFDPFNPNIETDVLNEKDVENIHWELIKSKNIDINSKTDPIAISFRQHLYDGLDFLLQEDRLQEADHRTLITMLYIAGRMEERYFTVESLQNFSCDALREIDKRWYDYPKRPQHFGFRVQKEIWIKNGSPGGDWKKFYINWRKFYIEVGWKTKESGIETDEGYVDYSDLQGFRDVEASRKGNLPTSWIIMTGAGLGRGFVSYQTWLPYHRQGKQWSRRISLLAQRTVTCKI